MDLENLTIRELMALLQDGSVSKESLARSLARLPGMLGQGARNVLHAKESHAIWPTADSFKQALAKALRDPTSGRPPELGKTAAVLGCDAKTLIRYCQHYLGVRTWRELLGLLVSRNMAEDQATDPSAADEV